MIKIVLPPTGGIYTPRADEIRQTLGVGWTEVFEFVREDADGVESPEDLSAFDGNTIEFLAKLDVGEANCYLLDISGAQSPAQLALGRVTVTIPEADNVAANFPARVNLCQIHLREDATNELYLPPSPFSLVVLPILE